MDASESTSKNRLTATPATIDMGTATTIRAKSSGNSSPTLDRNARSGIASMSLARGRTSPRRAAPSSAPPSAAMEKRGVWLFRGERVCVSGFSGLSQYGEDQHAMRC